MPSPTEIETKFWKSLKSDMTVMLGLKSGGHAQPMTAQIGDREGRGPIWFFTSNETDLARDVGSGALAQIHYSAKGHDLFACIDGRLAPDNDKATIESLWNPFVAAWFEEGKDDPKLLLLRFEPGESQFWLNENSLFAGLKMLAGVDPKQDYKDKVAEVDLAGG
jgi:general stress protein 26